MKMQYCCFQLIDIRWWAYLERFCYLW
jgi:hypothetical protein